MKKLAILVFIILAIAAIRVFGFGEAPEEIVSFTTILQKFKTFVFLAASVGSWWFFIVNSDGAKGSLMENITQYEAKMRWQRMTNENAKPPVDWNANRKNSKGWLARDSEGTEFFAIKEDDLKKKKK